MTEITPEKVIAEIRTLAQERPDFVYIDQRYEYETEEEREEGFHACGYAGYTAGSTLGEGCIVGQALSRLGVDEETLLYHDGASGNNVVARLSDDWASPANSDAYRWIKMVQRQQDDGSAWGDAVSYASFIYPEVK